jgi:hypothetical protein
MYLGEDIHNDAAEMVTSTGVIMKSVMRVEGDIPQSCMISFLTPPDEFDKHAVAVNCCETVKTEM